MNFQKKYINYNFVCKVATVIILCFSFAFLLWRAPFQFCFNDEPFCVTLAQRLYNGDALIADEWHGVQNFGAVVLPFYSIFRLFSPSNEGILLTFRYVYCILWFASCFTVYITMAKKHKFTIFVFLYLIFFSPLDYMTISYTSFGIMSSLLICCILYTLPKDRLYFSYVKCTIFSLLWVILVLCTPFMAIAYILFLTAVVIGYRFKRNSNYDYYFKNLFKMSVFSTLLIAVIAIVYLYEFVFSRAELNSIISSIPHIFSDPEHSTPIQPIYPIYIVYEYLKTNCPYYFFISCAVFFAGMFGKGIKKHRIYMFTLIALLFVYAQLRLTPSFSFNCQMLLICVIGVASFALIENKPWQLLLTFGLLGGVYTYLISLTSNTGLMAVSGAITVVGVFSIISICTLGYEIASEYPGKSIIKIFSVCVFSVVLLCQSFSGLYARLNSTYWDAPLTSLTATIEQGAAKGLRTTPERAANYTTINDNLNYLLSNIDTKDKTFLSCTSAPYIYLDANLDFATFSAWSFGYGEDLNNRILDYQTVNPDNIPDLVFCAKESDILPFTDNGYISINYNGSYLFVKEN